MALENLERMVERRQLDHHRPARKEAVQGIAAFGGKAIVAPAVAPALALGASRHFRRIDVGDPDPLAIAQADAVTIVDVSNARGGSGG